MKRSRKNNNKKNRKGRSNNKNNNNNNNNNNIDRTECETPNLIHLPLELWITILGYLDVTGIYAG